MNNNTIQQPFFQNSDYSSFSNANRVATSQEQTQDITIMTKEGDQVTISASSSFQQVYENYTTSSNSSNLYTTTQEKSFQKSVQNNFEFSVAGDLNDEEKKEIEKTLDIIENIMSKMMDGDLDSALSEALAMDGLDTIAAFEANMYIEQTVVIEQQSYMSDIDFWDDKQSQDDITFETINDMIDHMLKAIDNAKVEKSKLIEPIDELMDQLIGQLSSNSPQDSPKLKIAEFMHSNLINKLYEPENAFLGEYNLRTQDL